jgi:hypothetical protein
MMDIKVGRKLYYDLTTGEVIVDTGEREGAVKRTSIEEDIMTYKLLLERNRASFDVIELEFGEYIKDFRDSDSVRVNLETNSLEFSYFDPSNPEEEIVYTRPLSVRMEEVENNTLTTMIAVTESYETQQILNANRESENVETMLALTEAYEIIMQLNARIEALENK